MIEAESKSIVANWARSFAPDDHEAFELAAMAAVEATTPELRGPGCGGGPGLAG
jgi:hypothetical protein